MEPFIVYQAKLIFYETEHHGDFLEEDEMMPMAILQRWWYSTSFRKEILYLRGMILLHHETIWPHTSTTNYALIDLLELYSIYWKTYFTQFR